MKHEARTFPHEKVVGLLAKVEAVCVRAEVGVRDEADDSRLWEMAHVVVVRVRGGDTREEECPVELRVDNLESLFAEVGYEVGEDVV